MNFTYRQLQAQLKDLRELGYTNIKLNSKKTVLQAELNRIIDQIRKDTAAAIEEETTETTKEFDKLEPTLENFLKAAEEKKEEYNNFIPFYELRSRLDCDRNTWNELYFQASREGLIIYHSLQEGGKYTDEQLEAGVTYESEWNHTIDFYLEVA